MANRVWRGKIEAKRQRMQAIIQRLEIQYPSRRGIFIKKPFPLLIATILSQNTSDVNSQRAFHNLAKRYTIDAKTLAALAPEEIQPYIKIAGLYNIRSQRIINISKIVFERFEGSLWGVLQLPVKEAREKLMELPGIGPKTADILLAFAMNQPIMPVDTNIFRIALRIGISESRNYRRTQKALEEVIPKEKVLSMHFLLIQHGRDICKPRKPYCQRCPIENLCDYPKKATS